LLFRDADTLLIRPSRSGFVLRQKVDDPVDNAQIRSVMEDAGGAWILGVGVNPEAEVGLQA